MLNMFRNDAASNAFFLRQLEYIKAQTYDFKFPMLKAREFIPVSFEAPMGSKAITYRQYKAVGKAKIISSNANDLPRVNLFGTEFKKSVIELADAYAFTLSEIESAMMANVNLSDRGAQIAKEAIMRLEDELAFSGDSSISLTGFANDANVNNAAVATVGANTTWPAKLTVGTGADDILADLNETVTYIVGNSNGEESPDTILLSDARYALIAQTRIPDTNVSILKYFLETNPYIKSIAPWWRLATSGTGSTQQMIAYKRDPRALTMDIPMDFQQVPVQEQGLELVVPCRSKFGGVSFYYPKSAVYRYGL